MFIEVDVYEGLNCSLNVNRMFMALGKPNTVTKVIAPDPDGNDAECEVTGWTSSGPCQALAVLVEDSGEGVVMLLYGGEHGIRLKRVYDEEPWDLGSSRQWGEACLLLDRGVEVG